MRTTLILDSSQISSWFECPESWRLRYQENLVPLNKLDPKVSYRPSEAIAAGTLGHKFLELYYLNGMGKDGTAAALDLDIDSMDRSELDAHQFPLDPQMRQRVRNRFVDYISRYGNDYEVVSRNHFEIMEKDGILVDVVNKEPLVEKGFSYEILNTKEYLFVLEGRIDLIAKVGHELFWADHKFQLREHLLHPKSIQFRNYSLATGLGIGNVNYIRLHEKLCDKTFVRQPISFNAQELHYWKDELIGIFIDISRTSERSFLNRKCCADSGWGKPCMFNPICNEYLSTTREAIKKQEFTVGKEWRPW